MHLKSVEAMSHRRARHYYSSLLYCYDFVGCGALSCQFLSFQFNPRIARHSFTHHEMLSAKLNQFMRKHQGELIFPRIIRPRNKRGCTHLFEVERVCWRIIHSSTFVHCEIQPKRNATLSKEEEEEVEEVEEEEQHTVRRIYFRSIAWTLSSSSFCSQSVLYSSMTYQDYCRHARCPCVWTTHCCVSCISKRTPTVTVLNGTYIPSFGK